MIDFASTRVPCRRGRAWPSRVTPTSPAESRQLADLYFRDCTISVSDTIRPLRRHRARPQLAVAVFHPRVVWAEHRIGQDKDLFGRFQADTVSRRSRPSTEADGRCTTS